jgi:hypothetical protein
MTTRGSARRRRRGTSKATSPTGRIIRWLGSSVVATALAWIPLSNYLYAPRLAAPTVFQQQIYQRDPLELPFAITNKTGVTLFFLHPVCTVEQFTAGGLSGGNILADRREIGSIAPHETRPYKCGISFPEATLTKLILRLDFTYGVPVIPPLPWPRWTKTMSWRGDLRKRPNGELFWLEGNPLT